MLCVAVATAAGCGGQAPPEPRSYDLGLEAPAARLPAMRLGTVRASAPFESTDMLYRLAYRNAAEIGAYAASRWAAAPAEMMRRQLGRAAGEGGKCTLELEIQEFTQVFSAPETSAARIELRARLGGAERSFAVLEPGAGADAPSGAAAMARAANRAVAELGAWAAAQTTCR